MTNHILSINLLNKKIALDIIVTIHRLTSKIVTRRKMVVMLQSNRLW